MIVGNLNGYTGPEVKSMTLILQLESDYLSHDSIRAGYQIGIDGKKQKMVYYVREIRKDIIKEKKFNN